MAAASGAQGRLEGRRHSYSLIYSSWNPFSLAWKGGEEGQESRLNAFSRSSESCLSLSADHNLPTDASGFWLCEVPCLQEFGPLQSIDHGALEETKPVPLQMLETTIVAVQVPVPSSIEQILTC